MKSAVEALSLENQKTHVLPLLHATNWKGVSHAGSTSTNSIAETASGHSVKAPKAVQAVLGINKKVCFRKPC